MRSSLTYLLSTTNPKPDVLPQARQAKYEIQISKFEYQRQFEYPQRAKLSNTMSQYVNDQPAGFKNRIESIAIIGAGGSIGKHFTEHLLKTGKHTVTAITRVDSDSKFPDGVKVAKVNYDDKSSLVNALKGQDALIITMKTSAPKDTSIKLIEAAAEAKVDWIMPNEYGPDVTADVNMGNVSLGVQRMQDETSLTSVIGERPLADNCRGSRAHRVARRQFLGRPLMFVLVSILASHHAGGIWI